MEGNLMIKKTITAFLIIMLSVLSLSAQERFLVNVSGSLLLPSDGFFQETYGKTAVLPELRAGFMIKRNLYLLAGYGYLSRSAELAEFAGAVKSRQHFAFAGFGFYPPVTKHIDYSAEMGLFHLSYMDSSEDPEVDLSAFGLGFDLGFIFNFDSPLYVESTVGYLTAAKDIDTRSLKMGGTRFRLSLGIRF